MGYQAERIRVPIEWDVLISISGRCLKGRCADFIQADVVQVEIIPQILPAIAIWRLFSHSLGEFGTVEISRCGVCESEIFFTGLPHSLTLPPELQTAKEQHYRAIKDSYFFMLLQEARMPGLPEYLQSWKIMQREGAKVEECDFIQMYLEGKSLYAIGERFGLTLQSIRNKKNRLKKKYPNANIPDCW